MNFKKKAYDFKKGAEFGYNKCKEELNHKGLALQSDMDKTIEQNIALKKELNNVKKWYYVKDGDCCCDKTKDEIENDIEDYQEYMRYEEEVLAEEMERQRIANYDFERGDVKY